MLVSAAVAWEITTKHRTGKLPEAQILASDVTGAIDDQGFQELPITVEDAARAGFTTAAGLLWTLNIC